MSNEPRSGLYAALLHATDAHTGLCPCASDLCTARREAAEARQSLATVAAELAATDAELAQARAALAAMTRDRDAAVAEAARLKQFIQTELKQLAQETDGRNERAQNNMRIRRLETENARIRALLEQGDHGLCCAEMEQLRNQLSETRVTMVAVVRAAAYYHGAMTWTPASDPKWKPGEPLPDTDAAAKELEKVLRRRPGAALLARLNAAEAALRPIADAVRDATRHEDIALVAVEAVRQWERGAASDDR